MNSINMTKKPKVQKVQNVTGELKKSENNIKKRNIFVEILSDYCSSSTLHGISYLGAKDKKIAEKIWWLIMFMLSVIACSFVISKTWTKWKDNPVILSFENEQLPIWDVPFPAVTVCPMNKVRQTKYNFTNMYIHRLNIPDEEFKRYWDLSLVCNPEAYIFDMICPYNITDKFAIAAIREFAPNLKDTFFGVFWQNVQISIDNFAEQITEEGLCFTFNTLNQEDMYTNELDHDTDFIRLNLSNEGWTLEKGYSGITKINTYPKRTAEAGRSSGLRFNLWSTLVDSDYVCGLPISGFKIILHSPSENPKTSQQYFIVPRSGMFTMVVHPELMSTSETLQDLHAHTRKCYFSNEKYLKFYKIYTQNSCKMECSANITHKICRCVPFYMPRDNNTEICGYGSTNCVLIVQSIIHKLKVIKDDIPEMDQNYFKHAYEIFKQCECMPSCTNIHYSAETSLSETHINEALVLTGTVAAETYEASKSIGMSTIEVNIFFKQTDFFALYRSELYGKIDFLANCGGLLGLFMGFSLLSLIEIIYFSTIRFWFKYRNRQTNTM